MAGDLEANTSPADVSLALVAKIVPIALTFLSDAVIVGAHLLIDSGKIDQVLQNLLTNAFKFTPARNSVKVLISCRPLVAGLLVSVPSVPPVVGYLRVEVADTGVGISLENQENVFGEFSQFNRNKLPGEGGSGLGLWISRRIIDLHQGKMGFSSAGAGLGCSFFFELPLYSQPPGLTSSLVATRDPSHVTESSRSLALRTPPPSTHHFPVAEDRRGPVKVGGDVDLVYQFSADKNGAVCNYTDSCDDVEGHGTKVLCVFYSHLPFLQCQGSRRDRPRTTRSTQATQTAPSWRSSTSAT